VIRPRQPGRLGLEPAILLSGRWRLSLGSKRLTWTLILAIRLSGTGGLAKWVARLTVFGVQYGSKVGAAKGRPIGPFVAGFIAWCAAGRRVMNLNRRLISGGSRNVVWESMTVSERAVHRCLGRLSAALVPANRFHPAAWPCDGGVSFRLVAAESPLRGCEGKEGA